MCLYEAWPFPRLQGRGLVSEHLSGSSVSPSFTHDPGERSPGAHQGLGPPDAAISHQESFTLVPEPESETLAQGNSKTNIWLGDRDGARVLWAVTRETPTPTRQPKASRESSSLTHGVQAGQLGLKVTDVIKEIGSHSCPEAVRQILGRVSFFCFSKKRRTELTSQSIIFFPAAQAGAAWGGAAAASAPRRGDGSAQASMGGQGRQRQLREGSAGGAFPGLAGERGSCRVLQLTL